MQCVYRESPILQEMLLLKATSSATLSSLEQCLNILLQQQVSVQYDRLVSVCVCVCVCACVCVCVSMCVLYLYIVRVGAQSKMYACVCEFLLA